MGVSWSVAVVLTLASAGIAVADDPEPTIDDLFDQGRVLLAEHHPVEACAKFEDALKLDADAAGVLLNLGLCNEDQGKTASALRWFRKAQARGSEMKLAEIETAAKEHGAVLAAKVATVKLVVPRGTRSVTLDGERVEATSFLRIEVDAGHHDLAVTTADGTVTTPFDIADSQTREIQAAVAQARKIVVDAGVVRRRHAVELGVASGGLGVIVLGWATYEKLHTDRQGLAPGAYLDAKNQLRLYGTIGGSLAAVGLATAAILYVTAPGKRERIVPVATGDQIGVSIVGVF